ncbi:hypothetical protein HYT01_03050 [Candidatus Giovannonibacteria bacterium]|nr:hypothetical protein [Candidatus Giovannonibacteria bacterium]
MKYLIAVFLFFGWVSNSSALSFNMGPESFYYTADEIRAAFGYHYNHGKRLECPISWAGAGYHTVSGGEDIAISDAFVKKVEEHVKQMFEAGAARYLFMPDAGHAHLILPREKAQKYLALPTMLQKLKAVLEDAELGALYHTAEYLSVHPGDASDVYEWKAKRNVIGWFDGRPINILPPHEFGHGLGAPDGFTTVSNFDISAHREGIFYLVPSPDSSGVIQGMSFDISFFNTGAGDCK